jgi:uncharacterized membrane protein YhaH (DUF805 family)
MNNNDIQTKRDFEKSGTWFLFSVEGRICRKSYIIFLLIVSAGAVVLSLFEGATINIKEVNNAQIMYLILMFWPSVAVQAKRWHDRNRSALWVLIIFIPIVGVIWTLAESCFLRGTPGPNEFGPDPLLKAGGKGSRFQGNR